MLHVHRSERADALVSMLASLVAEPLADPMTPEVISVPTQGIERWLTQRLAAHLGAQEGRRDGVCANVSFPFPGVLVNEALAAAANTDPKSDPWRPERAVWPLMELVEEHFDEGWLAPLAEHMTKSRTVEGSKRFSSIRHVADLFDRYAVHRPDMLQRWADGRPQLHEASWQFELWSRLRTRIGEPSPAERLRDACGRLRTARDLVGLPQRLSLFGLTRLPASHVDVLEAMGKQREVHLFLLHPSPALWQRMEPLVDASSRHVVRRDDPTAALPENPLLASWGRDAREMQLVLGSAVPHGVDEEEETGDGPRTLLARIQDDVRADRPPAGEGRDPTGDDPRPLLADDDDSIRIHSCHGRARQVEVLRDAILHELEDDPTLELRDVIVMCPDIENFAPLIEATFGARDESEGARAGDPTRQLEIRLADRSLRRTNPMLGVLAEVLELPAARLTATQVLDLAGREPVRRRFLLSDDDLTRMEEWVAEARVRWGFDAEHRDAFGLGGVGANTWRSGLDRILLGVAMADEHERAFGGAVPLDDVDSADIELAGKLAEFVGRLQHAVDALAVARPLDDWAETLVWISDSLTATTPADSWQRAQLTSLLDELVAQASAGGRVSAVELSADDVRSLLADRLKGRPTRANFRTGHLTVCTLVPMRSIPHRVVCLLGLDDGSFPRHVERDGDDLTANEPRVGDRDVRSEDRQLLLDALLAARDRLLVTYSGHDERSNLPRPPAVPVGELLDVVDRTVRTAQGSARQAVIVTHPLQPFDVWNYRAGALGDAGPWSFDPVHLGGAQAAAAPRQTPPPFLSGPLPEREGPIELDLLERFVRHPVRVFLRERLGISLYDRTRDFDDAIPIDLDGLAKWEIGDRVLQARLGGADWEACKATEVGRGALPPGALAAPVLDDMEGVVQALVEASHGMGGTLPAAAIDVALSLDGLPEVSGAVRDVRGDVIHVVTYRRMQPSLRLAAWVRLLAATAAEPERPLSAVSIGREKNSSRLLSVSTIPTLGPDAPSRRRVAESGLRVLAGVFGDGMRVPLPLYCNTSAAYATARVAGADDADGAAAQKWQSKQRDFELEDRDRHHEFVLGRDVPFHDMVRLSGAPDGDERCDALDPPEKTRFGLYARLVWDDLLARETVTLL